MHRFVWLIVCASLGIPMIAADSAVTARLASGWKPDHSAAARAWLDAYFEQTAGATVDPLRVVRARSGLSHRDIHGIINDRSLGPRFFDIHADFMHPTDSVYVDPIHGAFHGQQAIRAWLVPTMARMTNISFDAVYPAEFFDDGEGGTSVDEWQIHAIVDGQWLPSIRGVSVRRYRDGWITYAVDYFDTTPARIANPQLPPPPRVPTQIWQGEMPAMTAKAREYLAARKAQWATYPPSAPERFITRAPGLENQALHQLLYDPRRHEIELVADLMHPTRSIYFDPIFGVFEGQAPIRAWYTDIMTKAGNIAFEPSSAPLFNGNTSFQEFRQVAVLPDNSHRAMTRGASVRRYDGGWVTYANDYFDTAPLADPDVQAASAAAGSTITLEDVLRYRKDLAPSVPPRAAD